MSRFLVLAGLLVPLSASAQIYGDALKESPQNHQLTIKMGAYTPNIDSETGVTAYQTAFNGDSMFMMRLAYDYQFWKDFGKLGVAFELGYASVTGNGRVADSGAQSSDETNLTMLPLTIGVVYAFDVMAKRWNVPIVPELELGFDWTFWWVTDGVGNLGREVVDHKDTVGAGDTTGFHIAFAIKLLLDDLAPGMAQSFDTEVGVNNTYIYAEVLYTNLNDFGGQSWDIGATSGMFGLAFEF